MWSGSIVIFPPSDFISVPFKLWLMLILPVAVRIFLSRSNVYEMREDEIFLYKKNRYFFSIENLWSLELLGIGKCSSLSLFLLFLDTGGNDWFLTQADFLPAKL